MNIDVIKIFPEDKPKTPYYLNGKIDLSWLSKAARLNGKAFHISILIWFHYRITKKDWFYIQKRFLQEFGISERALVYGLDRLENRGLIVTKRDPGKRRRIKIIK